MTKLRTLLAVLFVAGVLSLPFLQRSSAQSMARAAAKDARNETSQRYPHLLQ